MAATIGLFELTAVATGSVRSDDVLSIVDVHDTAQSPQGSVRKTTLAALYRTETVAVTVSTPLPDIAQTWNAGGATFTAVKLNVTDTASAVASLLLDLQVGGVSKASVRKDGLLTLAVGVVAPTGVFSSTLTLASGVYQFIGTNRFATGSSGDYNALYTGATNGLRIVNQADNQIRAVFGDAGGLTINTGGIAVTGNSTITGTLSGITTLIVSGFGNFGLATFNSAVVAFAAGLLYIGYGNSTSATAGGASALPATPLGYFNWSYNGAFIRVPYYNV